MYFLVVAAAARQREAFGLSELNSFQTTLTPNPGNNYYCNTTIINMFLNVFSKCFQVPVPVVWKSFNNCQSRVWANLELVGGLERFSARFQDLFVRNRDPGTLSMGCKDLHQRYTIINGGSFR